MFSSSVFISWFLGQVLIFLYLSIKKYSEKFFTFDFTVSIAFMVFTVCSIYFPSQPGNHNAILPLYFSLILLRSKWTEVSPSEFKLPPNSILHIVNSAANIHSILLCAYSPPPYFSFPPDLLKEFQRSKNPQNKQKIAVALKIEKLLRSLDLQGCWLPLQTHCKINWRCTQHGIRTKKYFNAHSFKTVYLKQLDVTLSAMV